MQGILERVVQDLTGAEHQYATSSEDHGGLYSRSMVCDRCFAAQRREREIVAEQAIEERFAKLVAEWRSGTGGLSSPRAIRSHPAYQQIIAMGEPALRHIFATSSEDHGGLYSRSMVCDRCFAAQRREREIVAEQAIEERFAKLVAEWRSGTGGLSSPRAIRSHPAYQQIIAMGEPALRHIFDDLKRNGGWWYPALRALTGQNPVPESAKGNPLLNDEAWLQWGRQNGYA